VVGQRWKGLWSVTRESLPRGGTGTAAATLMAGIAFPAFAKTGFAALPALAGAGEEPATRPGRSRQAGQNRAKQSQFGEAGSCGNYLSEKWLGEMAADSVAVKTKPICRTARSGEATRSLGLGTLRLTERQAGGIDRGTTAE
jgi:hypothetical protein